MRAIWTGAIGFGLVNIPVKIYSAIQASELDLDMLDKKDLANIKYQRVNANTGKEVPWANITRGYKLDGRYVVVTDDDFKKASPEKTKLISIDNFVDLQEVDALYFEQPYYLEPDKSGVRAYALLREALKKSGKVGIGTFVLRNRESLCMIRPIGKALSLNKLRFSEEIRDVGDLTLPSENPKPSELRMALELVKQLSTKFKIEQYKDTYSGKLLKLIQAKSKGKKVTTPNLRVVHSRSTDLLGQLKASLSGKKAS